MRSARRLLATAVVLFVVAGPWAPAAQAKSYWFPLVRIVASLGSDGSLRIVEQRTFAFEGSFSGADWTVDWPARLVKDLTVTEGATPVDARLTGDARSASAAWSFSTTDEERTWTISYTALCATKVSADAAHLLWKFVGDWGVPTDRVEIVLELPGVAGDVPPRPSRCPASSPAQPVVTRSLESREARAWGHGPYNGQVTFVDPSTVTFVVSDLLGDQYVEASVLLPPEAVPLARAGPRATYQRILDRETTLADRANEDRDAEVARLAQERRRRDRGRALVWGIVAFAAVLAPLLVIVARRRDRHGGGPDIVLTPPDDMHPAELAFQWSAYAGETSPKNVYRAQLLHLADERVIELQAVGLVSEPTDLVVKLVGVPRPDTPDDEFVAFLFPEGAPKELPLSSLTPSTRPAVLRRWWSDVNAKAGAAASRLGSGRARGVTTIALVAAIGASVVAVNVAPYVGAVAFVAPVVAVVGWLAVLKLTPPWLPAEDKARFGRWLAFRRFLTGFSSMDEAPALAVTVWERYLAYAVALDVADEVERQVRALIPEQQLPAPWPGGPTGVQALHWTHVMRTNVPVFATPMTRSTGGLGLGGSSHSAWSAGGFGHASSRGGFGGGFSGGGHHGGGHGGGSHGGTHGGAH